MDFFFLLPSPPLKYVYDSQLNCQIILILDNSTMHCTTVMFTMSFDSSVKCKVLARERGRGGRDLSKNKGLKLNLHKQFIYRVTQKNGNF